jgi:hypothetical protein
MATPAKYHPTDETAQTEDARAVLVRVLRVAFPHPAFPDAPYERTADTILSQAQASPWLHAVVTQGLAALKDLAGKDFRDLDDAEATSALHGIETTEFFGLVRRTTVRNFYNDPEVWELLGWEGASFDKGGYINRGFNDLDWLPEPRIDAYPGPEAMTEIGPRKQPAPGGDASAAAPTSSDAEISEVMA